MITLSNDAPGVIALGKFALLTDALDYIEANLFEELTQQGIAQACYCSLSTIQKLFRYALHHSINEYITKRRLSRAARMLVETDHPVTDIALACRYDSSEVFSRAFKRFWGVSPSVFRKSGRFSQVFPRIIDHDIGGFHMIRKRVDMSELYDVLATKAGTYVLCFDIMGLMAINEISHTAGDKAIIECVRRIEEHAKEGMLLFRIGGDEFALVTGLTDRGEAGELAAAVLAHNGRAFEFEGQSVPVSMHAGALEYEGGVAGPQDVLDEIMRTLDASKRMA